MVQYMLFDTKNFPLPQAQPSNPNCGGISYTLTQHSGAPIDPTVFNFIATNPLTLNIFTQDQSKAGLYVLKLTAT